jgi:hypothetical protein
MGGGGGGDVRGRRPSTAVRPLVGRWQGRFARHVDVVRVATGFGCGRRCGAVGPAVVVVHRRLCPVGWRRELAWPRARCRAWARTRGAADLKQSTWPCSTAFCSKFFNRSGPSGE